MIFKYLKPFALLVALCLILLFGQAVGELSLPNMMSDIVNVGIQKGGIDKTVPAAISENGFTLMTIFMQETDRQTFKNAYTLVEPDSVEAKGYVDKYPQLENEAVYILAETDKGTAGDIETLYGKASLTFMTFMQTMAETNSTGSVVADTENGFADADMAAIYQLLPMLQNLPAGTLDTAMETAESADPLLYSQVGVTFTKLFYGELGVDLDAMQQRYILMIGLQMLAIALAVCFASIGVGYLASRIAATVSGKMRRDVFAKVEHFSSVEFDKFSTASLITRTTNDVQQVQQLITMGIRMMCYAPILAIGGVVMAVGKSVSLSWTIAVAVVMMFGLMAVIFAIALPKFSILQKLIDRLNLASRENLFGMMVIRSFGNEPYEENRFDKANSDLTVTNRFVQRVMAFMMPAMMLIMNLVSLLIVWVGGHAIAESTLQIGDMMAFIQYAMQIIMSFLMIAMMFIMVPRASVSAKRIAEVIDTGLTINNPQEAEKLGRCKGVVEFKNVSFRYQNAEADVLQNISFAAQPGETTAFIGSTGSGKSTLINLIPRFYDVTDGSIEIDGVDIRNITQEELRDNIGYIPQKGILFSGDIVSNINYGKEDATMEEIAKAIEVAQAKAFVDSTENGIQTTISQGGTNVSGGQKQRLSIARALVRQAPVYIFDDSFSALDFTTDAALRKALKKYTSDATVLIVAQRVSTIMNAEQIVVLDVGKIVGIGTHTQLLQNCKEYYEIASSQLSMEELV